MSQDGLQQELAQYIEVGGIYFHSKTPPEVANLLVGYVDGNKRIRIDLGNTDTGESWSCDDDVEGYIRRSGGEIPVPSLLPTSRSVAGSPILCQHIVSIWGTDGSRVYRHPNYSPKYDWEKARIVRSDAEAFSKSPWQVQAKLWKERHSPGAEEKTVDSFSTEGQAIRWLTKKRKFERP